MKKFVAARIAVAAVLIGIILTVIAIQSNRTRQISPPPAPPVVQHPTPPIVKDVTSPPPVIVEVSPPPVVEGTPAENVPASNAPPTLDDLERQVAELEHRLKTTTSDIKAKQSALDALGNE